MKFRKKPVIVDAIQYTPGLEDGYACYEIGGRWRCDPEDFMQTYEAVDSTPHGEETHESIREAYRDALRIADNNGYATGYCDAVEYVLEILGVKITEVNA
ncbi:hypothetical protein C162_26675 [Paenibacillus sp. FSL R7-269]|uniref:hypothetical protein n=1 Tax=Paenibacillus sp. FSL R7-269 TaxID=1226755 RepID=UPI0003E2262A|nr:hypothetical protein [Paenibacillus sp. FSL R7-269]ETT40911.1 hypothetical protein C162_26675 [Paenibacillus sp. FSL R7-269]